MPTLDLFDQSKKKVGSIELSEKVFGGKVNIPLVHQVIKAQLADRRQGTAKTKTRTEVRGGGCKPFRQKGTGRARQGSTRSSIQVGGGQNFGPQPRSYEQKTPKKMIQGALRSALSDRVKAERLLVVDQFKFDEPKSKKFCDVFKKKFALENALVVDEANQNLELAGRNVQGAKVLRVEGLNVYDIIKHDWIVFSKSAVEAVQKGLEA